MKTQIFCMLAIISMTNVSFVQAEALDPITMDSSHGENEGMASQSVEDDSSFSISNIRANLLRDVTEVGPEMSESSDLETQGLSVMESDTGDQMIVDRSMVDQGITSAASPSLVVLSWDAFPNTTGYTVTRDGFVIAQLGAGVSSFRDTTVVQGKTYRYNVVPSDALSTVVSKDELSSSTTDVRPGRMWSMQVHVPLETTGEPSVFTLQRQATAQARRARAASTTTLSWVTFIPQSRIDAPPAGCDYGRGYQFGGDGHDNFDWRSDKYRTAVHAIINWSSKSVQGHTSVRPTTVYKKSTGKLVATKTASTSGMYAKKMGSGSNYVDVRMVTHASNPFCRVGAIDGAFSMHLTQNGNYSIFSGNHRLMPNHYVYIYDGGKVTDVYKRKYVNAACLIGSITCELANFYGSGSF